MALNRRDVLIAAIGYGVYPYLSFAAEHQPDPNRMIEIEVHLQEGFFGETVTVEVGGSAVAVHTANTRLMLGLAEIIPLNVQQGEEVRLLLGDPPTDVATALADATTPFVTVNLVEGKLVLDHVARRPGYV